MRELEKARVIRERAEAWRARAVTFSYVMLGLLYAVGAWFIYKIGNLIYTELQRL